MGRERIGEEFQEGTKHERGSLEGRELDWAHRPPAYKTYPGSAQVPLPPPISPGPRPFDELVRGRSSVRSFSGEPISPEQLSFLLWSSAGVREYRGGHELRTAPSAGALYPIETYLVLNNVAGTAPGLYHYHVKAHALEQLRKGDMRTSIAHAALEQEMCALAPAVFIWTAMFARSAWKYGQRAYRYVYLDAGHIAANLSLAAVSLEMGSCPVAATFDDEVNDLLGVDGVGESVLYLTVVGRPERTGREARF